MNKREKILSDGRIQTSFLAKPEKKALLWIAPRLPKWVSPDMLTLFGLFGMAWVGMSYYLSKYHWIFLVLASIGHIMNWFGDSLDGTLARVRDRQRPKYRYYFDHMMDAFGISFMIFGLAYSGLVHQPYVWVTLTLFFIAHINTYLMTNTIQIFKISHFRISTTEARVIAIIFNTVLIFVKRINLFGLRGLLCDFLFIIVSLFLFVATLRSMIKNLIKLDKEERALWDKKDTPNKSDK